MTRIELVYFSGCPHVASARDNLQRAIRISGMHLGWSEFDLDSADVPSRLEGLPSPTILVDGQDVSGVGPSPGGRSCRWGGAPTTETILKALGAGD